MVDHSRGPDKIYWKSTLTIAKDHVLGSEELLDTDVYDEGHQTSQQTYDTHQHPTQHLHVSISLQNVNHITYIGHGACVTYIHYLVQVHAVHINEIQLFVTLKC